MDWGKYSVNDNTESGVCETYFLLYRQYVRDTYRKTNDMDNEEWTAIEKCVQGLEVEENRETRIGE